MNKILCLATGLLVLNLEPSFGQPAEPAPAATPSFGHSVAAQARPAPTFQTRLSAIIGGSSTDADGGANLTKFSLDFPGGTPIQLAQAIEKAMGKPLNVIISREDESVDIPPLKMNDVVAPQLFTALEAISRKTVFISNLGYPGGGYSVNTSYGFKSADGSISDTSIWYFYVEKPPMPPAVPAQKICQFFTLSDFLNRGFTVDDITTAIQTGWKLAGETGLPELNYHKETKLLIAYGEPSKLKTIGQVLDALPAESAIHTRAKTDQVEAEIRALQQEVEQLKKSAAGTAASPGAAPSEEKAGK